MYFLQNLQLLTKFTLFRECDKLRKFVIKHDPGSKYRRHFGVSILFDLENLLTKEKNEYQASLKIVLKAKTEKDIPKDIVSKFEKILHEIIFGFPKFFVDYCFMY